MYRIVLFHLFLLYVSGVGARKGGLKYTACSTHADPADSPPVISKNGVLSLECEQDEVVTGLIYTGTRTKRGRVVCQRRGLLPNWEDVLVCLWSRPTCKLSVPCTGKCTGLLVAEWFACVPKTQITSLVPANNQAVITSRSHYVTSQRFPNNYEGASGDSNPDRLELRTTPDSLVVEWRNTLWGCPCVRIHILQLDLPENKGCSSDRLSIVTDQHTLTVCGSCNDVLLTLPTWRLHVRFTRDGHAHSFHRGFALKIEAICECMERSELPEDCFIQRQLTNAPATLASPKITTSTSSSQAFFWIATAALSLLFIGAVVFGLFTIRRCFVRRRHETSVRECSASRLTGGLVT